MATRILQKRLPWQYAYVLQIFNLSFLLQLVGSPDNFLKNFINIDNGIDKLET